MASSSSHFIFFIFYSFVFSLSSAEMKLFRPKALVLPVTKDISTSQIQYLTLINQRTPLVPVKLTVDLAGEYLWINYEKGYDVSSSYKPALYGSASCSLDKALCNGGVCLSEPKPGCYNRTCVLDAINTVVGLGTPGQVGSDLIAVQSTDGTNLGRLVSAPKIIFTCSLSFITIGLPDGVKRMAGLGRTKIGFPSQFAATFSFKRKFAVCLSSTMESNGVIFFGDGPYIFLPKSMDISKSLIYTPLILHSKSILGIGQISDPSPEYYIGVKSIKINSKTVPLNASLHGTRISTVTPYTILETSMYTAVVNAFVEEIGVLRVASMSPFATCFSSKSVGSTRTGPAVSEIDLVLQNEKVYWRIFGANSMVRVSDEVLCLALRARSRIREIIQWTWCTVYVVHPSNRYIPHKRYIQ